MVHNVRRYVWVGAAAGALWMLSRLWLAVLPDVWWFRSVGAASGSEYVDVYATILWTKIIAAVVVAALIFGVGFLNVWLAHRLAPNRIHRAAQGAMPWGGDAGELRTFVRRVLYGAVAAFGLALGYSAAAQWEVIQRWMNASGIAFQTSAGGAAVDPFYGRNVAYYLLSLPFEQFLNGWVIAVIVPTTLAMTAVYFLYGGILDDQNRVNVSKGVGAHLGLLAGLSFAALGWRHWLSRFELLYADNARFFGPGYVEEYARLPVLWILIVLCAAGAAAWFLGILLGRLKPAAYVTGLYLAALVLGGSVYPGLVERFKVEPNRLVLQREYIRNNIEMTRQAFGLDRIEAQELQDGSEGESLQLSDVTRPSIEKNIRLWDPRPLKNVYIQKQELRPQYYFENVDIDRYEMGDIVRQVSISPREVDVAQLTYEANDWINRTFIFTHGYGFVAGPVNETREGEPIYYARDIPVQYDGAWTHRLDPEPGPRVYYGERTNHPVIVNLEDTEPVEFDFPLQGEGFAKYTYTGKGGVPIDSLLRRATYAAALGNYNYLLNSDIKSGSRLMYRRNVLERVTRIAPFLKFDKDPYLVAADGRLRWMVDAYMTASNYPYSQPLEDAYRSAVRESRGRGTAARTLPRGVPWGNYIRNSVKAVVDVYDGSVHFYRLDTEESLGVDDPLLECYSRMFPGLFRPFAEMSDELKKHIRYPLTMLWLQARQLRAYNMTDPDEFFSQENLWDLSEETYRDEGSILVEPYYVTMGLPGETDPEFLLIYPFTPRDKVVMSAWMAARCDYRFGEGDGRQYGQIYIYRFPEGQQMPGTEQWESQFGVDPEYSSWRKIQQAEVLRGNLLLFPLSQGVLAIEPLYLESANTPIPLVRKVMAGYVSHKEGTDQMRTAMGDSLKDALSRLFGGAPTSDAGDALASSDISSAEAGGLLEEALRALRQYEAGESALQDGDWGVFGERYEELGRILKRFEELGR